MACCTWRHTGSVRAIWSEPPIRGQTQSEDKGRETESIRWEQREGRRWRNIQGGRNDCSEERGRWIEKGRCACVCVMNLSQWLIVYQSTFLPVTIQHVSWNRASRLLKRWDNTNNERQRFIMFSVHKNANKFRILTQRPRYCHWRNPKKKLIGLRMHPFLSRTTSSGNKTSNPDSISAELGADTGPQMCFSSNTLGFLLLGHSLSMQLF